METFRDWMELVGTGVDGVGVLIVIIGALYSTLRYMAQLVRHVPAAYHGYRQALGRSIMLGLEFLVAGDIIRTVVVSPTLENVIVLALIVLVRTFLSMALELELEGHWPWSRPAAAQEARAPSATAQPGA